MVPFLHANIYMWVKQKTFNNLKTDFDTFANENLKKSGDKYTPIDYTTFNDVNTLNSLAEQIDNWTNKEKKGGEILSAYEEYNKIMTDNYDKLCSDEKEKIDNSDFMKILKTAHQ